MTKKYICFFISAMLMILPTLCACSSADEDALAADIQNQSKDLGSLDLESDELTTTDIYVEPEYTLTSDEEKIAEKASEYMNQLDFSGSVLLCANDKIIYREAFGQADKKLKINNT